MKNYKKIFLAIVLSFAFSACGSSGTIIEGATLYSIVEKPGYTIEIPQTWREILPSEFPEIGTDAKAEAVFRSIQTDSGVIPVLAVSVENIPQNLSALEFSQKNLQNESVTISGFQILSEEEVEISGEKTLLLEFSAQQNPEELARRVWQTFLVSGSNGYSFTAAGPMEASEETKEIIRHMMFSIQLK